MLENPVRIFLETILLKIKNNQKIKSIVSDIYLTRCINPIYPFIFINFNKATDYTQLKSKQYLIDFDISIAYRQQQNNFLQLTSYIEESLKIENFKLDEYKVLGLRKQHSIDTTSQDTLTSKFSINYLAFIRITNMH